MGAGIMAPNGFPSTPVSLHGPNVQTATTHGFSERKASDYNNPASRFMLNAATTPNSAGSSQIHLNRGLYTPANSN